MSEKRFKILLPSGKVHPVSKGEFEAADTTSYHGHIMKSLVLGFPEKPERHLHLKSDSEGNLYLEIEEE